MHDIYKNIYDSNHKINKISNINVDIQQNKITNYKFEERNQFIPEKISNWINNNIKYNYYLQYTLNNRNININIYSKNKIVNIKIYFFKILLIINFLSYYVNDFCSKTLDIKIYLTPFKKNWDNISQLNEFNVNSGYSTIGCIDFSKLVVFREEEWYKVLIHELMHNFNLDFANVFREKEKIILKNNFYINSKYDVFETYSEFWARQLNLLIYSFHKVKEKSRFIDFYEIYKNALKKELAFSLQQANKLSAIIYLSDYNEKTNVFSYYVLTSILMYYTEDFILWCKNNNNNLINFKKNNNNIIKFIKFLIEKYYSNNYYNNLKKSIQHDNTMQMSIIR